MKWIWIYVILSICLTGIHGYRKNTQKQKALANEKTKLHKELYKMMKCYDLFDAESFKGSEGMTYKITNQENKPVSVLFGFQNSKHTDPGQALCKYRMFCTMRYQIPYEQVLGAHIGESKQAQENKKDEEKKDEQPQEQNEEQPQNQKDEPSQEKKNEGGGSILDKLGVGFGGIGGSESKLRRLRMAKRFWKNIKRRLDEFSNKEDKLELLDRESGKQLGAKEMRFIELEKSKPKSLEQIQDEVEFSRRRSLVQERAQRLSNMRKFNEEADDAKRFYELEVRLQDSRYAIQLELEKRRQKGQEKKKLVKELDNKLMKQFGSLLSGFADNFSRSRKEDNQQEEDKLHEQKSKFNKDKNKSILNELKAMMNEAITRSEIATERNSKVLVNPFECKSCEGNFVFNTDFVSMYQTIKEAGGGEYNFQGGVELTNEAFFDIFMNVKTKKNPAPISRDCYISAERAFVSKAGTEIGDESFGFPIDYFRAASLVKLSEDKLRVTFDLVNSENDGRYYLPQLKRLQSELQQKGCLEKCTLTAFADYDDTLYTLKNDVQTSYMTQKMLAFEKKFNHEYADAIGKFLKSDVPTYRISRYCAKIVKLIKVQSYDNNMNLQNIDNSALFGTGGINFDSFKIANGVDSETITTMVMADRECVLDRIFGRDSEE